MEIEDRSNGNSNGGDDAEHNHKWQRRILDRESGADYTSQAVGDEVVIETAKLQECPGCKRPGVSMGLETPYGAVVMFVHKRERATAGQPTEVCMAVPLDRPDLVMLDKDGEEQYAGPASIPQDKQN